MPAAAGKKVDNETDAVSGILCKDADGKLLGGTSPAGASVEPAKESFSAVVDLEKPLEAGKNVTIKVSVAAFLCKEGAEGFCLPKSYIWEAPLAVDSSGMNKISLGTAK